MSITALNHLTLAVSDLDRSIAFYSEQLGFFTADARSIFRLPRSGNALARAGG